MHPVPQHPDFIERLPARDPRVAEFCWRSQRAETCPEFWGVRVAPEAISTRQEAALLCAIESAPFVPAQSGKEKQHFGASVNFKKQTVHADSFSGLPSYTSEVVDCARRIFGQDQHALPFVSLFSPTDVFVLRYFQDRSSNLDFHVDDAFAYGEVILFLSMESDSVLTFLPPLQSEFRGCVRVPAPARSLILLYGAARFEWRHAILSGDIHGQRTSITLRTLSDELRRTDIGKRIIERAERSTRSAG